MPEPEIEHGWPKEIRLMWEHLVELPLWNDEGPLEDQPELLAALYLSPRLIADLQAWWADENRRQHSPPDGTLDEGWNEQLQHGRRLAARLQAEIGGTFRVRFP